MSTMVRKRKRGLRGELSRIGMMSYNSHNGQGAPVSPRATKLETQLHSLKNTPM